MSPPDVRAPRIAASVPDGQDLLPLICLHGIVDPLLNRACVETIVVVMAAAVPAAIADVCDELRGGAAGSPGQENAAA